MARVLVMTDSTCDVPNDWVRQYDIRIVPTYVQFGTDSLADDGIELTRPDFYARLVTDPHHPKTSAPSLGQTIEIMRQALADADHVLALTAPAALSGIFNNFRLAAEQLEPERVTLVDSQMVSMGMGWQVKLALEMIETGRSPADIKLTLSAWQPHIDVWAALDTMEYLKRSGRVGWATAMVGNLFQIKPIIRMNLGAVTSATRARTAQRAFKTLIDIAHDAAPIHRLALMHTQNLDGAKRLAEALSDLNPDSEPVIVEATPVLGVHVGPNGLGLAVVRQLPMTG